MRVVQSHPAENCESLQKVLVVAGEGQVIEFVDELHNAEYFAGGVADGLAQDGPVAEAAVLVNLGVEALVLVRVGNVDRLRESVIGSIIARG